tara:strand:+ start:1782 stop:3029 length:1248 start_codon:yes stop_codon:yes gene_type:complete
MKSPISCGSSFFPNMGKMKDINTTDMEGLSLWDYFVEEKEPQKFIQSIRRNFKYDSFFQFSPSLLKKSPQSLGCENGKDWIEKFYENPSSVHSFWVEKVDKLPIKFISINGTELRKLKVKGILRKENFNENSFYQLDDSSKYRIRFYEKNQMIFPKGMSMFKNGLVMMGVNFPPTISKFLYTHFTDDIKDQNEIIIYDPSMGYGGRLLGCLSVNKDRNIHYIGTDPNTDNWIDKLGISRYEVMGRFFNNNIKRKFITTYECFMEGSEVVHKNKKFQKYKGKVDFIFTSPPYFGTEGYSEDETQSYKKFNTYELWRDGFLKQTLKNCVDYLKPKRWLCWNISDTQFDGKYYSMERDSIDILKSLGMEYRMRYKMVLSGSISNNQIKKRSRLPSTKNFCGIRNNFKKYEPIFCFYKP